MNYRKSNPIAVVAIVAVAMIVMWSATAVTWNVTGPKRHRVINTCTGCHVSRLPDCTVCHFTNVPIITNAGQYGRIHRGRTVAKDAAVAKKFREHKRLAKLLTGE